MGSAASISLPVTTVPIGTCLMNGYKKGSWREYPRDLGIWLTYAGSHPTKQRVSDNWTYSQTHAGSMPVVVYTIIREPRLLRIDYLDMADCPENTPYRTQLHSLILQLALSRNIHLDEKQIQLLYALLVSPFEGVQADDYAVGKLMCMLGFDGWMRTACVSHQTDEIYLCANIWDRFVRPLDPLNPHDMKIACTKLDYADILYELESSRTAKSMLAVTRKRPRRTIKHKRMRRTHKN